MGCAGSELSPQRLIEAYRHGIFPWFSGGDPILRLDLPRAVAGDEAGQLRPLYLRFLRFKC